MAVISLFGDCPQLKYLLQRKKETAILIPTGFAVDDKYEAAVARHYCVFAILCTQILTLIRSEVSALLI